MDNVFAIARPAPRDPRGTYFDPPGTESERKSFRGTSFRSVALRIQGRASEADAMEKRELEARAIVSGGAGVNTAPDIVRALQDGGRLFSFANVNVGPNASTVVPILGTPPAAVVGSVPGATGTAPDSTAVLSGVSLTLKPWYLILQVSMGAVFSLDFANKFPAIATRSFNAAIDKGICVGAGSGSDMLGFFVASAAGIDTPSDVACGATGTPKLSDLLGIASTVLGLGGDPATSVLVVNPALLKACLLESTAGTAAIQNEIALKGTIGGVKIVQSSYALTTLTAGSYVATALDMALFNLAIAQEVQVDQIKTVGTDGVTFQAFMYMNGAPSIGTQARRLKTV